MDLDRVVALWVLRCEGMGYNLCLGAIILLSTRVLLGAKGDALTISTAPYEFMKCTTCTTPNDITADGNSMSVLIPITVVTKVDW